MPEPWLWLIFGLSLILSEFILPGFIVFFFGLSAIAIAALSACFSIPFVWKFLLFIALSLLLLFSCRRLFPAALRGKTSPVHNDPDDDQLVGARATVTRPIMPPRPGAVALRGTTWTATASTPIPQGTTVEILGRDNLRLLVRALPTAKK